MKSITAVILLLTLILVSCGVKNDRFRIEGRFSNLNQSEFYVYSPDGTIGGIDTIKIENGKFVYEIPCNRKGTLIIIFPNFSEQAVFTSPNQKVKIEGDASHLKEINIKGGEENKLMTQFREAISNSSPQEIKHIATLFIEDHPQSIVSLYILRRYFLSVSSDYPKASELIKRLIKAQPNNNDLKAFQKELNTLASISIGKKLPKFEAKTIKDETYSSSKLTKAKHAAILLWSSYNYESLNQLHTLNRLKGQNEDLEIFTISLDASKKFCLTALQNNNIDLPTLCDEQLLESPLIKKLGLYSIPSNIILKKGQIFKKDVRNEDLEKAFN